MGDSRYRNCLSLLAVPLTLVLLVTGFTCIERLWDPYQNAKKPEKYMTGKERSLETKKQIEELKKLVERPPEPVGKQAGSDKGDGK